MLLTMSPVRVVDNEMARSVPGWVVIESLKALQASVFLAIVGEGMIR
jgi:hypothetical protein